MDRYIKLLDAENKDVIVKLCGRKAYEYIFGTNGGWSRIGIMDYYSEDSSKYEKYEEISEDEAKKYISTQRNQMDAIITELIKIIPEKLTCKSFNDYLQKEENFKNAETQIVAILFAMGWECYQNERYILSGMSRIEKSIEKLFLHKNCKEERDIVILRTSRNTREIMCKYIQYEYKYNMISRDKYILLSDYFEHKIVHLSFEQKTILSK